MNIYDVAVIGGGSAGTMAAMRVVLNNDDCLFFPGSPKDKKKSRAFWVSKVENMPAHLNYKKGIEEPNKESLEWLTEGAFKDKFHWKKNRGVVSIVKRDDGVFKITDDKNEIYLSHYIILCTGVMDVQPKILGKIDPIFPYANVQLADYCLRCDGHHVIGKKLGVIGHTTSAAWVAIMLYERYHNKDVTIYLNGETGTFDDETLKLMNRYQFKIVSGPINQLRGDPKLHSLLGFEVENRFYSTEIVFIALGMIVYNELAKSLSADLDQRGFVLTDNKGKSSVEGLYIAGDLRANTKKQIYTAWDTAVDSADEINILIRRKKRIDTSLF